MTVTKKMLEEMSQFCVDCVVVAESLLLCRLEIKSGVGKTQALPGLALLSLIHRLVNTLHCKLYVFS